MAIRYESLINGFSEGIGTGILKGDGTASIFYGMIERKPGIYVLYSGKRIYYVGRSITSATRINQHFKDRLAGKWDNFSFYQLGHKKYLNDLEVLLIRATNSKQGKKKGGVKGQFIKSKNLTKEFRETFRAKRREEEGPLFENLEKFRQQFNTIKKHYIPLKKKKARQYRIWINKQKRKRGSRAKIRLAELREERIRKLNMIDSEYRGKAKPLRDEISKIKLKLDENKKRAKRMIRLT